MFPSSCAMIRVLSCHSLVRSLTTRKPGSEGASSAGVGGEREGPGPLQVQSRWAPNDVSLPTPSPWNSLQKLGPRQCLEVGRSRCPSHSAEAGQKQPTWALGADGNPRSRPIGLELLFHFAVVGTKALRIQGRLAHS